MSETDGIEAAAARKADDEDGTGGIHLSAVASGSGTVIQSGRDLHYHLADGIRHYQQTDGPVVDECPYPGLAPFTPEQARWFFGRDRLVAELVSRLDSRRHGGGPLIVVAPSGAGKSSLFQAGLIPAVDRGALPGAGSRTWPHLVFTPTAHPIGQAAAQIAAVTGRDAESVTAELTTDPSCAAAILRAAPAAAGNGAGDDAARVIVVVDQLEELFTLCAEESERLGFVELLVGLTDGAGGRPSAGLVICGLRADFYAPCTQYPQLRAALQHGQILLGPMSQAELRETILYPAQQVGLDVEPGLVELLLRDIGAAEDREARSGTGYEAGRLPLLAHALRGTWQQRHGSTLTVQAYQSTGGIQHAVAMTAEMVFTMLDDPARNAARRLFLRLVKLGEGPIEDTRRRATRAGILSEFPSQGEAEAVLDAFTQARLLTQDQDTIEITHEVLLRAWPRLGQWIGDDRAGNLVRQRLEDDATSWDRQDRDSSALYRGTRLAAAHASAEGNPRESGISPVATAFLGASNRQEHRAARIRRSAVAVLAALAVLATTAAVFAFREQASARASTNVVIKQRNRALSVAAAGAADALYGSKNENWGLAAQLSLAAYKLTPTPETYGSVLNASSLILTNQTVSGATNTLSFNSVSFNSAGSMMATTSADELQLWQVTPTQIKLMRTNYGNRSLHLVPGVWFSPSRSSNMLALLYNKRIGLFVPDGKSPTVVLKNPPKASPNILAFSHDGRMLAAGYTDGTVELWDLTDLARPAVIGRPFKAPGAGNAAVSAVALSPDGSLLAVDSGSVRLWNTADPANPRLLPSTLTATGSFLAFKSVGRILATGESGNSVQLWDVTDASHPQAAGAPLSGHTSLITGMTFSTDGNTLATASADNSVWLWDVTAPHHPVAKAVLGRQSDTAVFYGVVMNPNGVLATTSLSTVKGSTGIRTWLWGTDPVRVSKYICKTWAAPPITRVEWRQYFPGQPYSPPCPARRI